MLITCVCSYILSWLEAIDINTNRSNNATAVSFAISFPVNERMRLICLFLRASECVFHLQITWPQEPIQESLFLRD